MSFTEVIIQQLIIGLANGLIIAIIAMGYTMVYGILELINFAHGDLCMLGAFAALTILGILGVSADSTLFVRTSTIIAMIIGSGLFCAIINVLVEKFAYRPLRNAPKLAPLVSAIGVSFIFINIGLFWGGLPMEVFSFGNTAASPKDFPALLSFDNLLGENSNILLTSREMMVVFVAIPLLIILHFLVNKTKTGKAMRAVAQDKAAAALMGINPNIITSKVFFIGGAFAGVAAVMYSLYNNTISFQMGFRLGIDAFSAAVLGGIGSLTGAVIGGILIGVIRALSDQYIAAEWTNAVVFSALIITLIFRPQGILGSSYKEKV
jgi:branched-chain amino acid transport system permease protein